MTQATPRVTLAPSARFDADVINVGPGQRYDVIWLAREPGKWILHCHIPHHTLNNNVEEEGAGGPHRPGGSAEVKAQERV